MLRFLDSIFIDTEKKIRRKKVPMKIAVSNEHTQMTMERGRTQIALVLHGFSLIQRMSAAFFMHHSQI